MESNGARREVAFVLGGGGILGAHEVGMLRALAESSIVPDIVLGTSVGAINGALFAADPTPEGVDRLSELWRKSRISEVTAVGVLGRISTLARSPTHVESFEVARERLVEALPSNALRICLLRCPGSSPRSRSGTSISSTAGSSTRSRWAER